MIIIWSCASRESASSIIDSVSGMQFRRRLPGRSSTDFYLTETGKGGLSAEQQNCLADLVMRYREKYPQLEVIAVWDFGMEEGDPVQGEKYGVFSDSRDNAVYNAQLLTISVNHAKVRNMPCAAAAEDIRAAEAYYEAHRDLPTYYSARQAALLSQGVPWPEIEERILRERKIVPCAENLLSAGDPYFADVQAIRMLENTESLERLIMHEIGHMLSEESGAVSDKRIRKLFSKCRDGFENLYEFCAECFMAAELTDQITLANEYRKALERAL